MIKASFVLVNYNRRDELLITLARTKKVIGDRTDFEIIVVDNASIDGSVDEVKANFPDVILVENKVNTGAPAWNLGFAKATGKYFIIIDDDSHIVSGLDDALTHMDAHEDIGVLALNILSGPYTSKGWGWTPGQNLVGFIGCGAIYRKAVYDEVGGYADWMFLYVNEWDLGLRVLSAGYKVSFFQGCKVVHRTSHINRSNKRLRVFCTKHEMSLVHKYCSTDKGKYLWRIFLNHLKPIRGLHFKEAWYHLLGVREFFKIKNSLTIQPVPQPTQDLFVQLFEPTRPVFTFIKRDLGKVLGKTAASNHASLERI
jgi:GT2 family glycosyltransferase